MKGKRFMKKGIAILKRSMSALLVVVMLFTMIGVYIPAETFKAAGDITVTLHFQKPDVWGSLKIHAWESSGDLTSWNTRPSVPENSKNPGWYTISFECEGNGFKYLYTGYHTSESRDLQSPDKALDVQNLTQDYECWVTGEWQDIGNNNWQQVMSETTTPPDNWIGKDSIKIEGETLTIQEGNTATIAVTTRPANLALTYTSDDTNVATVDANGNVTAVAVGETDIVVKSTLYSDIYAECHVVVTAQPVVETIELDKTTLELTEDETATLTPTVSPEGLGVTWTTSDPSVATVDHGVVTAVGGGTATITATTPSGEKATCEVTVTAKPIYTYTIYIYSPDASHMSNSELYVWDDPKTFDAFKTLTTESVDGTTWLKTTVETKSKNLKFIFKSKDKWADQGGWQTADLSYTNTNSTNQTLYIVEGRSTVYTSLPTLPATKSPVIEGNKVTFYYNNPENWSSGLVVKGSFNGWGDSAMSKSGDIFTCTTTLAPGKYEYKFKHNPSNDEGWRMDSLNGWKTDDGQNNIFVITGFLNAAQEIQKGLTKELPAKLNYVDASGNTKTGIAVTYTLSEEDSAKGVTIDGNMLFVPESYTGDDLYLTVSGTVNGTKVSSTFDASLYTQKYKYTIYARSAVELRNSIANSALWIWDSANETILKPALYNFTETEVLADGNTWLKVEIELTASEALGIILKNNHAENWIWQTADLTFKNSAKTDQTIYIVDGYSEVYTDINKIPTEKYVYIQYVNKDNDYTNKYVYAWNNGFTQKNGDTEEGLNFPIELVNGQYIAKIPVIAGEADKAVGFIVKKGTGWDAKESGDNFIQIDAKADFAKLRFENGMTTHVLNSTEGAKIDRKNGNVTFYFRDKKLFDANNLASLDGKVSIHIIKETAGVAGEAVVVPMVYDEVNQRFYYQMDLVEDSDYYYYYIVNGEKVLDRKNKKTAGFENETHSLVRNKVYNVTLKPSLRNDSMDYNQNNVIYLTWEPKNPGDNLDGFNPEYIYVDLSKLGLSSKAKMNLDLMAYTFGCADDVEPGTYPITVTLVDDCDMSYTATVEIEIKERVKADPQGQKPDDFDWDEAVIYFAVTDRFFNGNPLNDDGDPENDVTAEGYNPNGPSSIHGGDFAGLTQKLDYLEELGVNTIWLTPIVDNIDNGLPTEVAGVDSYGYHGYWASDFTKLNPHLGDAAELRTLISEAHARGMKIMVDVVLNHAGYDTTEKFNTTINLNDDPNSAPIYKDMIRDGSVSIDEEKMSLNGLPDFLTEDEDVRKQLIEWQTYWMTEFDIDYYRVDTVKHVDDTTWEAFKIALTEQNPEFKMIGEYYDAGFRNDFDQLDTGKMDSVLDFHFNDVMVALTTQDFAAIENALQMRNVLLTNTATMGSFLSSHDENGFLYDLVNKHGQDANWANALMMLAATYQITAKGQPVIYYGEELGMTGANNYPYQDNRKDWNESLATESNAMYQHYKTMLNIRKDYSEVFAKGDRYSVVLPNVQNYDGTVVSQGYEVFARSYNGETIYVGTNLWADTITAKFYVAGGEGSTYKDLYSKTTYTAGANGLIEVDIPAANLGGTVVLVKTGDGTAAPVVDNNKVTVKIHYNRPSGDYEGWNAWLWSDTTGGAQYDFVEENGEMVATITVEGRKTNNINFRIRYGDWKDNDHNAKDQSINISDVVSGTVHYYVDKGVWGGIKVLDGDAIVGNKIVTSSFDRNTNTFKIVTTRPIKGNIQAAFNIICTSENDKVLTVESVTEDGCTYTISVKEDLSTMHAVLKSYAVEFDGHVYSLVMPNIYSTKEFEDAYTYEGKDLGLTYGKDKSTFKVWAPTADKMVLNIYASGTKGTEDLIASYPMELADKGVWVYELEGDHAGKYYTYSVTVNNETKEVCDPYARTTGVNGARAMILDLDSTDPEGWAEDKDKMPNNGMSYTDAVIYELHVRDLSSHSSSGIKNTGKFLGLTETGTKTEGGQLTGLDHMIDLGITHLHLLPIYDYASVDETRLDEPQFNWGYDPLNYNVPEGSYSTNPYDGASRVSELKEMVKALHDNNINVIMDVVYNHVYDAGTFGFNQLVPSYFSRTNADGSFSNGSGCGNDTATERAMVHKYVVESILYWHEEYHIDGFRFDLVGLLDTVTINKIVDDVHAIDPDIIFYGEGWTLGTALSKDGYSMATQANARLTPGFAYFNDRLRNGVAGSDTDGQGYIWISGKEDLMKQCFTATTDWCPSPSQTVNYVSCHDNYTLMDKINVVYSGQGENYRNNYSNAPGSEQVRLNNLAASLYMLAEGIPFIHAGEEFLRIKLDEKDGGKVIHNSYNASDEVNTLRWYNLDGNALYADTVDYYEGLIEFRKNHEALRLTTSAQVSANVKYHWITNEVIMFVINGKANVSGEASDGIVIIYNASNSSAEVDFYSKGAAQGTWNICINDQDAGVESLGTVTNGKVTVPRKSCMALVKGALVDTDTVYMKNNNVKLTLGKSNSILQVGGTDNLGVNVYPANSTLLWNSSNESVATVDEKGNVKALAQGTTTITVSTLHGVTATCTVTVVTADESVSVDKTTLALKCGAFDTITATIIPSDRTVTWSSSDETVATVDQNGKVTAVGTGTATITARTPKGATVSCVVTVTHDLTKVGAQAATCTDPGCYEHYTCACGKVFLDKDATEETTLAEVTIGVKGHTLTEVPAKTPNCTEAGNNKYYKCETCGKYYKDVENKVETTPEAEVLGAKGHTLTKVEAKEPTTTATGNIAYYACGSCGNLFLDEEGKQATSLKDVTLDKLQPEDPKPEDPKPEDPKPEDPKPEDPKPEDPKPEDPKPEDPKPEDPKPEDPKPEDPKPEDPKPEDPKPEDPKPEDPKEDVVYVPENKVQEQVSGEADKLIEKLEKEEDLKDAVSEETLEKLQDAIANNKEIITELVIENKKDVEVEKTAKDLVETAIKNFKETVKAAVAQYLDIKVVLKTEEDNEELGTLNKLSEEIVLTFEIPSEWKKEGRIFNVIRVHEGATDVLDVWENEDGTVSFKTDRFSTYALVYTDPAEDEDDDSTSTPNPDDSTTPDDSETTPPDTGDKNMTSVYFFVLLAGLAMAITGVKTSKRKYVK